LDNIQRNPLHNNNQDSDLQLRPRANCRPWLNPDPPNNWRVMNSITVYLAGEIHSDWRDVLRDGVSQRDLPVQFVGPQEQHGRSDAVGEDILGRQGSDRYRDLAGAGVNTLRTRVLLRRADLVVA